jgi:hypothetical protein
MNPRYKLCALCSSQLSARLPATLPVRVWLSGTTLVVVPAILMDQWLHELNKFVEDGSLRVCAIRDKDSVRTSLASTFFIFFSEYGCSSIPADLSLSPLCPVLLVSLTFSLSRLIAADTGSTGAGDLRCGVGWTKHSADAECRILASPHAPLYLVL